MTCTAELTEKKERLYSPAVDIFEQGGEIVLRAEMPGVDEKSVDITIEKNLLSIAGRVEPAEPLGGYKLVYSEHGVGSYRRDFKLTDEIDRDRITASVRNGVLTLAMPKAEAAKGRKIEVMGASVTSN